MKCGNADVGFNTEKFIIDIKIPLLLPETFNVCITIVLEVRRGKKNS